MNYSLSFALKMTAGSVAVPTIIPLKAPHGSKYCIDSATRIEIRSGVITRLLCILDPFYVAISFSLTAETPDTIVFYTLNGSRPEPFQRSGKPHTFPFKESFALNPGKVFQLSNKCYGVTLILWICCILIIIGNYQGSGHISRWL